MLSEREIDMRVRQTIGLATVVRALPVAARRPFLPADSFTVMSRTSRRPHLPAVGVHGDLCPPAVRPRLRHPTAEPVRPVARWWQASVGFAGVAQSLEPDRMQLALDLIRAA